MKNNSWQPAVTEQCAEMMTITNSSGTPTETTVFHVYCNNFIEDCKEVCKAKLQQRKKNTK